MIEHPLLPLHIKEMMSRILFNNLQVKKHWQPVNTPKLYSYCEQVPSISFASSHLLALLAAGRITGLVLDCGHLESTVLPVSCRWEAFRRKAYPDSIRSTRRVPCSTNYKLRPWLVLGYLLICEPYYSFLELISHLRLL